ncbi:hypothetical protein NQZ68_032607 [Dissostichus eleginoides]|nr:hypothetical protein NQZ68_032607 [Dissostichus eleginoides]
MEEPGPSRKKRFVSEEKRKFQEKWSNAYFVLPQGSDKVICLICKQVNAMLKDRSSPLRCARARLASVRLFNGSSLAASARAFCSVNNTVSRDIYSPSFPTLYQRR